MKFSAAAGAPRPTGVGTTTSSARPTPTATAVAAPPSARLRPGDRRTGAANRNGFSMKRRVSTASPPEISAAASLAASPSGWPINSRGEHQHRPVPQIPRVGDPADRAHRRQPQDAAASLGRCGAAGADHQRRAQGRQQRGDTRIERVRAEAGAGQQDQGQPGPSRDRARAWRESAPLVGREGHQAAGGQLPGPGGQRKERRSRRPVSGRQRQRERDSRDQRKDHQIRALARRWPRPWCAYAYAGSATPSRGSTPATPGRTAPRHPTTSSAETVTPPHWAPE